MNALNEIVEKINAENAKNAEFKKYIAGLVAKDAEASGKDVTEALAAFEEWFETVENTYY